MKAWASPRPTLRMDSRPSTPVAYVSLSYEGRSGLDRAGTVLCSPNRFNPQPRRPPMTRVRVVGSALATALLVLGIVALFSGSSPTLADPPGSGGAFCGGIAGIPCPSGCVCVDDPRDDCNPKRGGADCSGICRPAPNSPPGTDCSGGGSESIADGSYATCDPLKEPGLGENPSCAETYTCTADGVWLCIQADGTPTP